MSLWVTSAGTCAVFTLQGNSTSVGNDAVEVVYVPSTAYQNIYYVAIQLADTKQQSSSPTAAAAAVDIESLQPEPILRGPSTLQQQQQQPTLPTLKLKLLWNGTDGMVALSSSSGTGNSVYASTVIPHVNTPGNGGALPCAHML